MSLHVYIPFAQRHRNVNFTCYTASMFGKYIYFKLAEIGKFGSLLETRESFYRSEKTSLTFNKSTCSFKSPAACKHANLMTT